jgi:hypothetical protein
MTGRKRALTRRWLLLALAVVLISSHVTGLARCIGAQEPRRVCAGRRDVSESVDSSRIARPFVRTVAAPIPIVNIAAGARTSAYIPFVR